MLIFSKKGRAQEFAKVSSSAERGRPQASFSPRPAKGGGGGGTRPEPPFRIPLTCKGRGKRGDETISLPPTPGGGRGRGGATACFLSRREERERGEKDFRNNSLLCTSKKKGRRGARVYGLVSRTKRPLRRGRQAVQRKREERGTVVEIDRRKKGERMKAASARSKKGGEAPNSRSSRPLREGGGKQAGKVFSLLEE